MLYTVELPTAVPTDERTFKKGDGILVTSGFGEGIILQSAEPIQQPDTEPRRTWEIKETSIFGVDLTQGIRVEDGLAYPLSNKQRPIIT